MAVTFDAAASSGSVSAPFPGPISMIWGGGAGAAKLSGAQAESAMRFRMDVRTKKC
jgi:hypothetical protein